MSISYGINYNNDSNTATMYFGFIHVLGTAQRTQVLHKGYWMQWTCCGRGWVRQTKEFMVCVLHLKTIFTAAQNNVTHPLLLWSELPGLCRQNLCEPKNLWMMKGVHSISLEKDRTKTSPPPLTGHSLHVGCKKTKEKSQHLSTGFFFILYFIILYGQVLVPVAMP